MVEQKSIRIRTETYDKLQARKHFGQSLDGIISELLYDVYKALCPLCGNPDSTVPAHKKCMDREAFLADKGVVSG